MFYVNSMHILNVFEKLMFLSKHESLCGISNIFSWQTIWDLLKVFLRSHIKLWHQKDLNQKTHICLVFGRLYANYRQILNVFENLMFVSKHEPLCGVSHSKNIQTLKSCILSRISCICVNRIHIFERLLTFVVLVQARAALRDRRKFFWTNNLRLVKNFLEIIKEALIAKIYKPWNRAFCLGFRVFVSIVYTYLNVCWLLLFWSKHELLCGIAEKFFQQIIWGLLKNFLRSSRKLS